jgi:hypothetical protein
MMPTKMIWMSMIMGSDNHHDGVLLMITLKAMKLTPSFLVEIRRNPVYLCL